jgi:hypothetical protein
MVLARVLGLLLLLRGDEVGYGRPEDFLEPVLNEPPRGVLPEPEYGPPPDRSFAPLEIDTVDAQIGRALAQDDAAQALRLYRLGGFLPGEVGAAHMQAVAQRAAAEGDYPYALSVFNAVLSIHPRDPLVPKVMVLCARIHAERLNDEASARALYQRVVESFPGTEAARYAEARLAA